MKKLKLLIPMIPVTLAATIVPMSSCSYSKKGNLMTEYTPTEKRHDQQSYTKTEDVINEYLSRIKDRPQRFEQDLIYTFSRGLPQYAAYISDYCEVTDYDYNVDVELNPDDVDIENKTVTFTVTLDMYFDYSKTPASELLWYDMYDSVWDATTVVKFVFDFNTYTDAYTEQIAATPDVQKCQMATLAGATEFGVSEVGSTLEVISQKGWSKDVYGKKKDQTTLVGSDGVKYHFMLPSKGYWDSRFVTQSEYLKRIQEAYEIWFKWPGAQPLVLLFKRYLPNHELPVQGTAPNTFDFGSYYMYNSTLNDTFCIGSDNKTVVSFNKSLDSTRNLANLEKNELFVVDEEGKGTFTLPAEYEKIAPHAFDGNLSTYTNLGIPLAVDNVIIPNSYRSIGADAFAGNPQDVGLSYLKLSPSSEGTLEISPFAFDQLLSLRTVDLHEFDPSYAVDKTGAQAWTGAFSTVHSGLLDQVVDGYIILPHGWKDNAVYEDAWRGFLENAGFGKIVDDPEPVGWVVVEAPE